MSDYVPIAYPKWVNGVLVENAEEEHALLDSLTAPSPEPEPPHEHE